MRHRFCATRLRRGFTLIEILIVIAIITLLAAILFPAFRSAREQANQANCATNLHQIGLAVQLYYQDEKRYPSSLAFLLPNTARLNNSGAAVPTPAPASAGCDSTTVPGFDTCANTGGGGYMKSMDALVCPDDDNNLNAEPRSSYGDVSTGLPLTFPTDTSTPPAPTDLTAANASRFIWNYWGYNKQGFAFIDQNAAAAAMASYVAAPSGSTPNNLLVKPNQAYGPDNRISASMSNRFAPSNTIITHCIYHRLPTSNLNDATYLYGINNDSYKAAMESVDPEASSAKDIVLRLDGSAKAKNIGGWPTVTNGTGNWQTQRF